MELRQLRGFVAVAGCGTVTEGAHSLGLAPASVSEQIRRLEDSLGVRLFDRTPSGMRLTGHGRAFLPEARGLLDHADAVRGSVRGHPRTVRVGTLETLVATHVPGIVRRLADRRPDIGLDVHALPRRRLLDEVARGGLDAGLLLDAGAEIGSLGFDPPSGLEFLDVGEVGLTLVAAPGGSTETLLVTEGACSFRMAADQVLGDHAVRREFSGVSTVRAWARQGLGMALLPDFAVAEDLASGALVDLAFPAPTLALRLVWQSGREPHLRDVLYAMSA
ncbi:LysR family transcriptional regulator [Sphaerisporangium corydalis]|uniref:LysR family transcriptional regulator n=1 Tax=Sphaerisporangium corydalis TaxID=1441875 RepID=A0ABV9EIX7_9ACTN|nr:LysR family transcriptional regulator [Sphaerisporangium corydalis]